MALSLVRKSSLISSFFANSCDSLLHVLYLHLPDIGYYTLRSSRDIDIQRKDYAFRASHAIIIDSKIDRPFTRHYFILPAITRNPNLRSLLYPAQNPQRPEREALQRSGKPNFARYRDFEIRFPLVHKSRRQLSRKPEKKVSITRNILI